jgi:hypothetical protein
MTTHLNPKDLLNYKVIEFAYQGGSDIGAIRRVRVIYIKDMLYDKLIHGVDLDKNEFRNYSVSKIIGKIRVIK